MQVDIKLEEYGYRCPEGCCYNYGMRTTVNGEELDFGNTDTETIVQGILEKLGYNVTIETIYED